MSIMEQLGEQEENSYVNSELSAKIDKPVDNSSGCARSEQGGMNRRRFN